MTYNKLQICVRKTLVTYELNPTTDHAMTIPCIIALIVSNIFMHCYIIKAISKITALVC